jgi:Flp pilus assembly protein TadD
LLELARPADALREVSRGLTQTPNDPELLELLGLCHLRLHDLAAALLALRRAIQAAPVAPHPQYLYGYALKESGNLSEASAAFATALQMAPEEPVYLRSAAELCADLGRFGEALSLARRATAAGPDSAPNFVTLGFVASAAGDKALARAAYERAMALDPASAAAWNNLGCLDLEGGRPLAARARFREALRLDPGAERASRNLALSIPREVAEAGLRTFGDLAAALMRELTRAGAPRTILLALVLEEPAAGRALLGLPEGGAATTAAVIGWSLVRAPLPGLLLLSGAAGAYMALRRALSEARRAVRATLDGARPSFDAIVTEWLAGARPRGGRDQALRLLVEEMAAELMA